MKTKHHIYIASFGALTYLLYPLMRGRVSATALGLVSLATVAGSIFPDADMRYDSKIYKKSGFLAIVIDAVLVLPLKAMERIAEGRTPHRGIFHTLIGVLLTTFGVSLILLPIEKLTSLRIDDALLGIGFFFLAQMIHLILDSTTISGTLLLYPFSKRRFKGPINTFKDKDLRPVIILWVQIFLALIVFQIVMKSPGYQWQRMSLIVAFQTIFLILIVVIPAATRSRRKKHARHRKKVSATSQGKKRRGQKAPS